MKTHSLIKKTLLGAVLLISAGNTLAAQPGRDWAVQAQKATFSFNTLSAQADMTLYRGNDVIGTRSMVTYLLEQDKTDFDMGVIEITSPTSLSGTRLLSWSNEAGDDQQWLKVSGNNRSRRIGNRGRRATFVNSDFTFEDLLKWQVDDYRYELIGTSSCPAGTCTQVQATPISRSSAYGKMLVDYDGHSRISRIQYFRTSNNSIWKEQIFKDYRRVGSSWQPDTSLMLNHETGSSTQIKWSNYQANPSIDPAQFQPN